MREEITEPQHWRANTQRLASRNVSWSTRRRSQEHAELAAEAIDAALTEEADRAETHDHGATLSTDVISNLASQLDRLERQREQLQQLLAQAQASK